MSSQLAPVVKAGLLPPVLAGHQTGHVRERVEQFYMSVAEIFERWVARRKSHHTQRAYREDVMSFVRFMGIEWPRNAPDLLTVTLRDVQAFRDEMLAKNAAPKTLNRRISSLSSFYKYLGAAAAELRLPVTVSNPARGAPAAPAPPPPPPPYHPAGISGREGRDAGADGDAGAPTHESSRRRRRARLPGPGYLEALPLFGHPALDGLRAEGFR